MPCPECGQSLRKISTASRLFYCHSSNCTSETISVGCFTCDFHMCQNCVDRQRLAETERRSFVSPKLDFEPTAPSYDMVVSNDNNRSYNNTNYVNLNAENNILKEEDDYLPSNEQAIAMNKETQE